MKIVTIRADFLKSFLQMKAKHSKELHTRHQYKNIVFQENKMVFCADGSFLIAYDLEVNNMTDNSTGERIQLNFSNINKTAEKMLMNSSGNLVITFDESLKREDREISIKTDDGLSCIFTDHDWDFPSLEIAEVLQPIHTIDNVRSKGHNHFIFNPSLMMEIMKYIENSADTGNRKTTTLKITEGNMLIMKFSIDLEKDLKGYVILMGVIS